MVGAVAKEGCLDPGSREALEPAGSMTAAELEALGEEIATFAARIDVATHAMLTRLRTFDAHEAWGSMGMRSCAHWLSYRTGIGLAAAREKVRVARALGELSSVDAYFARGELSYSRVRAIVRVATPKSEQDFIDIALHSTASQLERLCRAYERTRLDVTRTPREMPKDQRRFVRRRRTRSGMDRIEIQLPPEEANLVWQAMESALDDRSPNDAIHGSQTDAARADSQPSDVTATESAGGSVPSAPAPGSASVSSGAQHDSAESNDAPPASTPGGDARDSVEPGDGRRATKPHSNQLSNDSAESPSAVAPSAPRPANLAELDHAPRLAANDPVELEDRRVDAFVDVARAYLQTRPRTLGAAYELAVITTPEHLRDGPDGIGGFLRDGTPLPVHVARMLASDGSRVDISVGERGELLDVGRRTRTIPPAIARALWLRDGGCRFPGCTQRNHLRAHHIVFWMHGGPTSLDNLVLVCGRHHRLIHEHEVSVQTKGGMIEFLDPRGNTIPTAPPTAATGEELEELELFLQNADLYLDPSVNAPRWDGTPLDLDEALSWMHLSDATRRNATARNTHGTEAGSPTHPP